MTVYTLAMKQKRRERTLAHKALSAWLNHITMRELAELLEVDIASVSRWNAMKTTPDTVTQLGIYMLLGIHPDNWLTKQDKIYLEKIKAKGQLSYE